MRRLAPRPLGAVLAGVLREARPPGLLARVQGAWADAVGPAVAAESDPVAERDGVITVACSSAVWAQELELLGPELTEVLSARVGGAEGAPARLRLRFVTRS